MADQTRAQTITRVLQRIGVLGVGQTADTNDETLVGTVLDSIYADLRKRGLAPFLSSAVPDWAQEPFAKVLSFHAAAYFGKAGDPSDVALGERELFAQTAGYKHPLPVVTDYY